MNYSIRTISAKIELTKRSDLGGIVHEKRGVLTIMVH